VLIKYNIGSSSHEILSWKHGTLTGIWHRFELPPWIFNRVYLNRIFLNPFTVKESFLSTFKKKFQPGQSSKVPFCADVRSGSKDDQQIFLFGHFQKSSDVQESREVVVALAKVEHVHFRLVKIPRNITFRSINKKYDKSWIM